MINKKGSSKYLSPWWFLILVIIGVGIVAGVFIFYSKEINIKNLEAGILFTKIVECVIDDSNLNTNFLDKDFDVFSECKLNKDILSGNAFHGNVSIYEGSNVDVKKEIVFGNGDIRIQCGLKGKYFAECAEGNLISADGYKIRIFTGSNNLGVKGK